MQDAHPDAPIPLLDLDRQNAPIREEILAELAAVYDSGRFLYGPQVTEFEQTMAQRLDVAHAVGCASGSDALLLALMALDIQPGDRVLVPSFTFFATASAVVRLGATPVFVDIDLDTYNMDPNRLEDAITDDCRAIIPVHLFGQSADMTAILDIATRHGLPVVEDAAQAVDASWRGKAAGAMGDIGCFSFYPTKNLGGMGDGGLLTTNDDATAVRLRRLAAHGMEPRYYHSEIGINSRLDTFQAAVLGIKLRHLADWAKRRAANAQLYRERFAVAGHAELVCPSAAEEAHHVWNQFTIRIGNGRRDALKKWLADHDIGSEVYYPVPLHQQECMIGCGDIPHPLTNTEQASREVLSLPCFAELRGDELERVVECCLAFVERSAAAA